MSMVSVGLTWQGSCLPGPQRELIRYLERIAALNDELCQLYPPRFDEYAGYDPDLMTSERSVRLRARPNVDRIDRVISENIEIDSNIFRDREDFARGAEQLGLPIIGAGGPTAQEAAFVFNLFAPAWRATVRLKKASIYGINFKIHGTGYPREDRVSLVFLHCPEFLFLDGRIVDVYHRNEWPGLIHFDTFQGSDWYACAPDVHLRYYLEEWFDHLFSWAKFFFMPDLHWWRHDDLPNWDRYRPEFEALQKKIGAELAKAASFEDVVEGFKREAAAYGSPRQRRLAEAGLRHRSEEMHSKDHSGLRGRALRVLRDSGSDFD
jgi:hypothetical protein